MSGYYDRILWPKACIGCGETEGITSQHHKVKADSEKRERQFSPGPMKTYKVTRYSMSVDMTMYLCDDCKEIARRDVAARKKAKNMAFNITFLLTLILPILVVMGLPATNTMAQNVLIYLLAFILWIWIPIWFLTDSIKFTDRKEIESYFTYGLNPEKGRFSIRFRTKDYFDLFVSQNPGIPVAYDESLNMSAGKGSLMVCITQCSGCCYLMIAIGVVGSYLASEQTIFLPVILPAVAILLIGLGIQELIKRTDSGFKWAHEHRYVITGRASEI